MKPSAMSVHRHRPFVLALVGLLAAGASAACSSSGTDGTSGAQPSGSVPGKTVRLGFSPLSLDIPGLQDTANALKNAGASAGISVTVADPKFNVQTQVTQIQQWIQLHQIDALWVIPIAPPAIAPLIAQAQAAKIPILVDTQPSKVGFAGAQPGVSFASTDYPAYGKDLGDLLVECIDKRLGGQAQIVSMKDPSGQTSNADTDTAVATSIASLPGAKIVRTISPATQLAAQQNMLSALQAAPQANAALGTNDEAVLGAVSAFQQAGKDPTKSCIVGGGSGAAALAAIKAGTVYGGATFDFQTDTRNNITEILTMQANPTGVGKVLTVPIKIVRP
jgi:ABC-type sugar transport system substrate-binding protein